MELMEVDKAIEGNRPKIELFNQPEPINTMLPMSNQGAEINMLAKGSIPSDAVQNSTVQGDFVVNGRIIVKDNLNYNRVVIGLL
jgi:hypothetical protein